MAKEVTHIHSDTFVTYIHTRLFRGSRFVPKWQSRQFDMHAHHSKPEILLCSLARLELKFESKAPSVLHRPSVGLSKPEIHGRPRSTITSLHTGLDLFAHITQLTTGLEVPQVWAVYHVEQKAKVDAVSFGVSIRYVLDKGAHSLLPVACVVQHYLKMFFP